MFKKLRKNEKGFTLAELLIVVAIIGVLVAISIPIFTSQLEKSRDAVSVANMRTAYAEAQTLALTATKDGDKADKASWSAANKTVTVADVEFKGKDATDEFSGLAAELPFPNDVTEPAAGKHNMTFTYDTDGSLKEVAIAQ